MRLHIAAPAPGGSVLNPKQRRKRYKRRVVDLRKLEALRFSIVALPGGSMIKQTVLDSLTGFEVIFFEGDDTDSAR